MAAGFECDVEGRALRAATGLSEGEHFSVGLARPVVIALSDDQTFGDYQGADHRIRAGLPLTLCRKAKGLGYVMEVLCAGGHRLLRAVRECRAVGFGLEADPEDFPADFLASASAKAAWAAASLAMATR